MAYRKYSLNPSTEAFTKEHWEEIIGMGSWEDGMLAAFQLLIKNGNEPTLSSDLFPNFAPLRVRRFRSNTNSRFRGKKLEGKYSLRVINPNEFDPSKHRLKMFIMELAPAMV